MSADNYWYICEHPNGGFTYVMGFASDDEPPEATMEDTRFKTANEALMAALDDDWTEYGESYSPAARADMGLRTVRGDDDAWQ